MGVTTHSDNLVQKHKGNYITMLELGSQNTYFDSQGVGVAKEYYTKQGFEHTSIDMNGEYGSLEFDLSEALIHVDEFDIVTDFGTSEHVDNYYSCWLNKHNGCKVGGLIISENPKVDNWHGHGFHYLTQDFYIGLSAIAGYEVVELGEHPAMGNVTDGWNIYCVLRKVSDLFPAKDAFYALPFESSVARTKTPEQQVSEIEAVEGLKPSVTNDTPATYTTAIDTKTTDPKAITGTLTPKPLKKRGRPANPNKATKAKK